MDVVVVGGGIVGLASAYYLAERGADVTVCERASLGAGSTERSIGGIRAQFSTPENVALSLASMAVWEDFEEEFGVDVAHRRVGYLLLTREEATAERFREDVALQNDRGVPSEFLAPADAREHCPGLDPGPFVGATYSPTDGFADPHLALDGFARAAADAGAEIRTNTPVSEVLRADAGGGRRESGGPDGGAGPVVGVRADGDRLDADHVVLAAGAWTARVAATAGVDLPIEPRRRQMAVVDPDPPVPETVPLTIDIDTSSHFRPERDGRALVGGTFGGPDPAVDPDAYDGSMGIDWAAEAVERAGAYADYFGPETRLRRGWAGLYAVTPDHNPVVEEVAPGLVVAAGFSGHGFQHSPATGQVVADLVLSGETSLVNLGPFRRERFDGDVTPEANVA